MKNERIVDRANWLAEIARVRDERLTVSSREGMFSLGRITACWPGLASTWHRGDISGLATALLSCWLLSFLLLASFVWPQWMPAYLVRVLWLTAFIAWVVETARSQWNFASLIQTSKPLEPNDIFMQAQTDYLQGNYFDAEQKLLQVLSEFPRDAECQLLLVSVLRHTQRYQAALRRLAILESWDSAARWRYEIAEERKLIERKLVAIPAVEAGA